jgi:hypothetical protein
MVDKQSGVAIIGIQIGPWPDTVELFLRSCRWNPSINWIIFSDHNFPVTCPNNVKRIDARLGGLRDRFSKVLGRRVRLDIPYKLCDYRPMFGEIFSEELAGYDFWGHCDFDVVFGRIRDVLPPQAFADFDKILVRGNFALYRNSKRMNTMFRHLLPDTDWQSVVATNKSCRFDEWPGIYKILVDQGVAIYNESVIADIDHRYYDLRLTHTNGYVPQMITSELDTGKLILKRWIPGREFVSEEKLLIHLQKRKFHTALEDISPSDLVVYGPNRIRGIQPNLRSSEVVALKVNPRSRLLDASIFLRRVIRRIQRAGREVNRTLSEVANSRGRAPAR